MRCYYRNTVICVERILLPVTGMRNDRHSVRYILTCSAFGLASKESWWLCGYDNSELQPRTRLFATTGDVLVW